MTKKTMRRSLLFTVLLAMGMHSIPASALSLYLTHDNYWFDPQDRTQVQATVELTGLGAKSVDRILRAQSTSLGFAYGKLKVKTITDEHGQPVVQIRADQVSHAELIILRKMVAALGDHGAQSLSPEIPLAPKVLNMENQLAFVSSVSGIYQSTLKKIVAAEKSPARRGQPLIFRYNIEINNDREDREEILAAHQDAIVGQIPVNVVGQMPVAIDGNSTVFHLRMQHGTNILGRHNPGLINQYIAQALTTNKYVESRFWNEYVPGAMPETHLLEDFMSAGGARMEAAALIEKLNRTYPEGWVIKGVRESNSNFKIITEKVDVLKELADYENSDFKSYEKMVRQKYNGADEDTIYEHLQDHKNYFGFRISQYLSHPENAIVQKKLKIDKEFRVDVVAGRALKNGTTIDRYNWLLKARGQPYTDSAPEVFVKIDNWVQSVMDRLPIELRGLSGGFDAAFLKDGGVGLIEANLGTESSSLGDEPHTVTVLNDVLKNFQALEANGEVVGKGLSNIEQMKFIFQKFKKWGIDVGVQYRGDHFYNDRIETSFTPVEVPARFMTVGNNLQRGAGSAMSCQELFK
jgi:hypothetical protein